MEFSNRLKESRKKLGLTQDDLAKESLVSISTIKKIESENRIPKIETINKLAKALNISTDYLIGRTDANVDWSEYDSQLSPEHFYRIYLAENGFSLNNLQDDEQKLFLDSIELSSKERKVLELFINMLRELRK